MPTQCNPNLFVFAPAEGRPAVASFGGGAITSDAGASLLGATDRVLGLTRRLAACFKDSRNPAYTEHAVEALVMRWATKTSTTTTSFAMTRCQHLAVTGSDDTREASQRQPGKLWKNWQGGRRPVLCEKLLLRTKKSSDISEISN